MDKKKAFIFDTNFIRQNLGLTKVIETLKDKYNVYVSQVTIDERIGQRYREDFEIFEELQRKEKDCKHFAKISYYRDMKEVYELRREGMQQNYNRIFDGKIVPIPLDSQLLDKVLKRACDKLPPFSGEPNASDKGFKDCLIWFSIIEYFKNSDEDEILFLTDDNGFLKNATFLSDEFTSLTNKKIEIKPNKYYKDELLNGEDANNSTEIKEILDIANIDELRDEIEDVFYSWCKTEIYDDDYGDSYIENVFVSHIWIMPNDTNRILNQLPSLISKHIFEKSLSASELLDIVPGNIECKYSIDIKRIEKGLELRNKIAQKYPEYYEQFIGAVTKILNSNYVAPDWDFDDDDLPF